MSKIDHLETTILRTLSDIYRVEVKDNDIGFLTLTEVRLTNDYRFLTIYYTILGKDTTRELAAKALQRSKKYVRTLLASRVKMRKVPELLFKYDTSLEYGNKIEAGLEKVIHDDEL